MYAKEIPAGCQHCGWILEHGATLWQHTIKFADCPLHGWLQLTVAEMAPLLEWLSTGWWTVDGQPTEPIRTYLRRIERDQVRGHVPTVAGRALGELLAGEWMPHDMLPYVKQLLTSPVFTPLGG